MANIKTQKRYISPSDNKHAPAQEYENYLKKEREPDSLHYYEGMNTENAIKEFMDTQTLNNKKDNYVALEVIESWPSEYNNLPKEQYQEMGANLIRSVFPGHAFYISTQFDESHTHVHILVNPIPVDGGNRIRNSWDDIKTLRAVSNDIDKQYGIHINWNERSKNKDRAPKHVKEILKRGGTSWEYDLKVKADLARSVSRNHSEYTAILAGFNIGVRFENKNISYMYPGKGKAVRAKQIGSKYNRSNLEKSFFDNIKKQIKNPDRKNEILKEFSTLINSKGVIEPGKIPLLIDDNAAKKYFHKEYSRLVQASNRNKTFIDHEVLNVKNSFFPIQELYKAQKGSIIEYAQKNNIDLIKNKDSTHSIKGRPYIIIDDRGWRNIKSNSKVRGGLVEFVSLHKDISIIQSIASINNNPRLELFNSYEGRSIKSFKAFYFPKSQQELDKKKASQTVSKIFKGIRKDEREGYNLFEKGLIQVSKKGSLRLLGEKEGCSAIEFSRDNNTTKTKLLTIEGEPFLFRKGVNNRLYLSFDPVETFKEQGPHLWDGNLKGNSLALINPKDKKSLDLILAKNSELNEIIVIGGRSPPDILSSLKSKYMNLDLNIEIGKLDIGNSLEIDINR